MVQNNNGVEILEEYEAVNDDSVRYGMTVYSIRSTNYDTRYTYDSMGNILTLKRRGMKTKHNTATGTPAVYGLIDDLTFVLYGNQTEKVTDAVSDDPYYQGAGHYLLGNAPPQSNETSLQLVNSSTDKKTIIK